MELTKSAVSLLLIICCIIIYYNSHCYLFVELLFVNYFLWLINYFRLYLRFFTTFVPFNSNNLHLYAGLYKLLPVRYSQLSYILTSLSRSRLVSVVCFTVSLSFTQSLSSSTSLVNQIYVPI